MTIFSAHSKKSLTMRMAGSRDMPGHPADLNKRGRSGKKRRIFVARLKQTEIGERTKDLVNETGTSLAAKYSLPTATRKKSRT